MGLDQAGGDSQAETGAAVPDQRAGLRAAERGLEHNRGKSSTDVVTGETSRCPTGGSGR